MDIKIMARIIIIFSLFIGFFISNSETNYAQQQNEMTCKIIRKITLEHCKRGARNCKKCQAVRAEKICLLDICPDGVQARRVIQVERDGKKSWREFDLIKIFQDEPEARKYADENGISDFDINQED